MAVIDQNLIAVRQPLFSFDRPHSVPDFKTRKILLRAGLVNLIRLQKHNTKSNLVLLAFGRISCEGQWNQSRVLFHERVFGSGNFVRKLKVRNPGKGRMAENPLENQIGTAFVSKRDGFNLTY